MRKPLARSHGLVVKGETFKRDVVGLNQFPNFDVKRIIGKFQNLFLYRNKCFWNQ